MNKKLLITYFLIFASCFTLSAGTPRFLINTGHVAEVSTLAYLEGEELIFTASYDGAVKAWDMQSARVKYHLQVSHMPVRKLAVSNKKPYLAAVESDGINAVNMSVWNWETGELLFRHRVSEAPLFIKFSPQGNFLIYGKTEWDSLVFLDSKTGKPEPFLKEGFGIVSEAFISTSERTLLTYSNSGSLQYWNLTTGEARQRFQTFDNLQNISFISSGRYMTAYNGREILLIDLTTGRRTDSIPVANLIKSVIDQKTDSLLYISRSGRALSYNTAEIDNSGFREIKNAEDLGSEAPSDIISVNGKIFTAWESGEISVKNNFTARRELFSSNNLLKIDDFAVNKTSMAITSPGKLLAISTDFFTNEDRGSTFFDITSKSFLTDVNSSFGVSSGRDTDFLLWHSESRREGNIRIFNEKGGISEPLSSFSAPLISAEYKRGKLLTLNKNGDCSIIDYDSGESDFSYTSYGIRTVDFIEGFNIIAGRNGTSSIPAPLLHINTVTGETVPIDDSNMLIFELEYDALTKKLYTLGFEKRNGLMRTVLKEHTGRNHDRAETIISFPGEDIGASFSSDSNSSKIFTTLGYKGVKMLYWGGFTQLESTFSIPRKLELHGSLLAALNQDSSFTIWDAATGLKVIDLYIFDDLSWAALLSEGKYYASPGAEKYINIYDSETNRALRKKSFLIQPGKQ